MEMMPRINKNLVWFSRFAGNLKMSLQLATVPCGKPSVVDSVNSVLTGSQNAAQMFR